MSTHQRSRPSKNPNTSNDRLTLKSSHKHRYSFKKSRSRSRERDSPRSQGQESPLLYKSKSEESGLYSPGSIHKPHAEFNFSVFSGQKSTYEETDFIFDPVLLKEDSIRHSLPAQISKDSSVQYKNPEWSHKPFSDSKKFPESTIQTSKPKNLNDQNSYFDSYQSFYKASAQEDFYHPTYPSTAVGKQEHMMFTSESDLIKWDMHCPPQARCESDSDEDSANQPMSPLRRDEILNQIRKNSNTTPPESGRYLECPGEKLNLVLDIDETMVNTLICESQSDMIQARKMFGDNINEFAIEGTTFLIILRPFAKEFIEKISFYYNIFIYSHAAFEYVLRTIDLLDPEGLYIRRDIIFKKDPANAGNNYKKLSLLNLPREEVHRTLILDDQRQIWSNEEQSKVIPSRKFIPFRSFRKEASNKYYLFQEYENRWVIQPDIKTDFQQYAETRIDESQLPDLLNFLADISRIWNHNRSFYASVDETYQELLSNILRGCRANVVSDQGVRQHLFEATAQKLGAEVVNMQDAEMVFVDDELDEEVLESVKEMIPEEREVETYSASWITEAFFTLKRPMGEMFKKNFDLL